MNCKIFVVAELDSHRSVNGIKRGNWFAEIVVFVINVVIVHGPRLSGLCKAELGQLLHYHERIALRGKNVTITEAVVENANFEIDKQFVSADLTHLDSHSVIIVAHLAAFAPRGLPGLVVRRADSVEHFETRHCVIILEHEAETRIRHNLPVTVADAVEQAVRTADTAETYLTVGRNDFICARMACACH